MARIARWVLLLVNVGNWIAQAVFMAMLASLVMDIGPLAERIASRALPGKGAAAVHLFEIALLLGPPITIAVHRICIRAIAMIDTLLAGTPFIAANARRLHDIGWALLALQMLDLIYGRLAFAIAGTTGRPMPWAPGLTGWIAVLLVFVLARVFAEGTRMQDDLEGTV